MRRVTFSLVIRSFLKGLIIIGPIAVTIYLIYFLFSTVDNIIPNMYPGLGVLIVVSGVTLIGFFGTRSFLGKTVVDVFDHLLERTPGIKYIYSSIKDVMDSFVGDKKRFNQPVWVRIGSNPEVWRIGFLTQPTMEGLGLEGKSAVYLPHSYAISGWVIVVDTVNIMHIHNMSAAEAMKFAVSGGVTTSDMTPAEMPVAVPEAEL